MALKLVSVMAPNADFLYQAVAEYLSRRGKLSLDAETSAPWQERERMLDTGEAQVGAICGLGYVRRQGFELLAAPVMREARYGGAPVYFSELLVARESAFERFEDLEGARWAYNEKGSHSGYNIVRYHLATAGRGLCWFGEAIEAGTHQAAMACLDAGTADCAAIDSTVLEQELRDRPALAGRFRSVATLGPSPIPPVIAKTSLTARVRETLRRLLVGMHEEREGARILAEAGVARFAAVTDAHYEPIREMDRMARSRCDAESPPSLPLIGA